MFLAHYNAQFRWLLSENLAALWQLSSERVLTLSGHLLTIC